MIRNGRVYYFLRLLVFFLIFLFDGLVLGTYSSFNVKYVQYVSLKESESFLKVILPFYDKSWILEKKSNTLTYFSDFATLKINDKNLTKIRDILGSYKFVKNIYENNYFIHRDIKFFSGTDSEGSKTPFYLQADMLWAIGIRGQGVKVGIFDTGIDDTHPHFRNAKIMEITNWTNEPNLKDVIGHGTFVAGILISEPSDESSGCSHGISPDVELYIFRLFTRKQTSYTSWFLDAFNYAMARKIHIINLSIGGPDFQDRPFVEKVWELSANGILMVSANGNDGPLYGTQNNPADQMDVIGVGGIDFQNKVTKFSSRGMTTWELPNGYGRVKPDVVAYSSRLVSTSHSGGCKVLSGTSVASPSVAAMAALLISSILPTENAKYKLSPAMIKQALLSSATRLVPFNTGNVKMSRKTSYNMFEQGMGKINLLSAYRTLMESIPQVSAFPSYIDLTESPYMWPYSQQPLYSTAMPIIVNVTLLNSMGVTGTFKEVPEYFAISNRNGDKIQVYISHSETLWPWSGYLSVTLTVPDIYSNWSGITEGYIKAVITSKTSINSVLNSTLIIPLKTLVIAKPPRMKRILWDQFHNLRYPPGYIPRDNIRRQEPLDWTGDHIHTNFKDSFTHLRSLGYYIEVLGSHYGCFSAENYGYLILMDPEEEYYGEEIEKLYKDVTEKGLSLIVVAEWYSEDLMKYLKFYDENTRRWWTPDTGGANVPALNDLLSKFGIQLSTLVLEGQMKLGTKLLKYLSGTSITKFPDSDNYISRVVYGSDFSELTSELVRSTKHYINQSAIIGFYAGPKKQLKKKLQPSVKHGRIVVMGDSNCFDMTHRDTDCLWLWNGFLHFAYTGQLIEPFISQVSTVPKNFAATHAGSSGVVKRLKGNRLHKFSSVIKLEDGDTYVYRPKPACRGNGYLSIKIDRFSEPNKTWYRPQILKKMENPLPMVSLSLENGPLNKIYRYYRRRSKMSVDKSLINDITEEGTLSRHFILYLICVVSCCGIVMYWLCRRIRPRVRELKPVILSSNRRGWSVRSVS